MREMLNPNQCLQIIADLADLLPLSLGKKPPAARGSEFNAQVVEGNRTRWDPVFTGGGIVNLLITDPAAPVASLTKDIDLVLEIASYTDFIEMEDSLRRAGFTQNMGGHAPIVAWEWRGVRIDFLPHQPIPLMQSNRWFPHLIKEAEYIEALPGRKIWRASAPCFIATKLEAFHNRGNDDYLMSKDIEDILAVIDGRIELLDEVHESSTEVQGFIRHCFSRLIHKPRFLECLPGLVPDEGRDRTVLRRMHAIAG